MEEAASCVIRAGTIIEFLSGYKPRVEFHQHKLTAYLDLGKRKLDKDHAIPEHIDF